MIACDFTGPIPGRASSSSLLAVLMLIFWPGLSAPAAAFLGSPFGTAATFAFEGSAAFALGVSAAAGAGAVFGLATSGGVTFTLPWSAASLASPSPLTLDRSPTDLYG